MSTNSTTGASELLLSVIAIRLAVLVLAGWSLALLPRQARDGNVGCVPLQAASIEAPTPPKMISSHVGDPIFADMRLHD
ncbi:MULTISPECIES: hypothetical protein [unclassified Bradyrhizobium]|uniref:hypothetical protein n=1 Tax=unclassified Bradyrhizobium TaxID=2631580 RepID=UPI001FFAD316|nr:MULTISPECIES: hypothetical protein [unclassified Bradyrhizobium]MCK1708430.1 hypothetical protein [Bradyrhizobium sp. 143]MCK1731017.1 hypothetical protein [Bradyrhizobium sp. 142]